MRPLLPIPVAIAALTLLFAGCRAPECQQMIDCCEAAEEDLEDLGDACGDLAEETRDPQTCRDVVRTLGYMYEESERSLPAVCESN